MTRRRLAVVLVVLLALVALVVVVRAGSSSSSAHALSSSSSGRRVVGYGQIRYAGAGPELWAFRFRRARRELVAQRARLRALRRELLSSPSVAEAIDLAAATYGGWMRVTLWRKARCETGGTFDPRSLNPSSSASGLFQFLPSTWRTTPYARFDVLSPYANALAAGWMHRHGRAGEWVCQ